MFSKIMGIVLIFHRVTFSVTLRSWMKTWPLCHVHCASYQSWPFPLNPLSFLMLRNFGLTWSFVHITLCNITFWFFLLSFSVVLCSVCMLLCAAVVHSFSLLFSLSLYKYNCQFIILLLAYMNWFHTCFHKWYKHIHFCMSSSEHMHAFLWRHLSRNYWARECIYVNSFSRDYGVVFLRVMLVYISASSIEKLLTRLSSLGIVCFFLFNHSQDWTVTPLNSSQIIL